MSDGESILARIREALTLKAAARHGVGLPTVSEHRRVLPSVGESVEEQFELFARNSVELKATFRLMSDEAQIHAELQRLVRVEQWQRVAAHSGALALGAVRATGLPTLVTTGGYDKFELEQCDVGITECDALIAQTGTVLVTSRSAGGRALSCLPPHHVVVARREQLVSDLPAALALVKERYADDYPSMISFITGPSRTGDIERILVLGAHGPKQLTILCF